MNLKSIPSAPAPEIKTSLIIGPSLFFTSVAALISLLLSGDKINAHNDANIPFVKSGDLQHRYQIYLEIDNNVKIVFNKRLIEGSLISNSVIDFPLKSMHYYSNNSNSALYLLVFDDIGTSSGI